MKIRTYIKGTEVNDPVNLNELEIELNYNDDSIEQSVSTNEWEIGLGENDGYTILENEINQLTEGVPFKLELEDTGTTYTLFDGYLDLWDSTINTQIITANATEQGQLDWLNNVVDSFSFDYLYEIGKITANDAIPIPYVISKKNNGLEVFITALSIYTMIRQIVSNVNSIVQTVIQFASLDFTAVIRVALQILELVVLLIAAIKLTVDLFNLVVQPVKYHYGMKVSRMIEIGLEHIGGLKLSSSILKQHPFDKLIFIPEKFNIREDNVGTFKQVTGILDLTRTNEKKGYDKGTFGDFFRRMKLIFNAKLVIDSNTVYFEKQNFKKTAPRYTLPPFENTTGFKFNKDEFYSNYLLKFETDLEDRNTIQEYLGTSVQIITTPKVLVNKKMQLTKNLQEISFGVALGKRKTTLSFAEQRIEDFNSAISDLSRVIAKVVDAILQTISNLIKTINKIIKALKVVGIKINPINIPGLPKDSSQLMNKLNMRFDGTRINMLKLESDYISVPKLILVDVKASPRQNVLLQGNETYLSARYMWDNFHSNKSFVPNAQGEHNQHKYYEIPKIPFTVGDFPLVKTSNYIFDSNGVEAKLLSLKYNPIGETATGRYKVNELYTTNLKQTIIEPDGR